MQVHCEFQPHLLPGMEPLLPLYLELSSSQNLSEHGGKETNPFSQQGSNLQSSDP